MKIKGSGTMGSFFKHQSVRTTVTLIAIVAPFACNPAPKSATKADTSAMNDPRTSVALPGEGQQAVLKEMRQMLGAIGGALSAASRGDTAAVLAALAPAGSAAAADPQLEALLPPSWKELAERTHGGFDSLSMAVRAAPTGQALKDTVLVGIARISGSCTSCHETFRVTIR